MLLQCWLSKVPGLNPQQVDERMERGSYTVFDPTQWAQVPAHPCWNTLAMLRGWAWFWSDIEQCGHDPWEGCYCDCHMRALEKCVPWVAVSCTKGYASTRTQAFSCSVLLGDAAMVLTGKGA